MRHIDLHERIFKYDASLHSDEEMRRAVDSLFQTVYTDLAAGCSQRDLDKYFESVRLPAFVDLLGDALSDCKVPSEKIDEIQAWCRAGGKDPSWQERQAKKPFSFKEYT